jgi:pimeloyl-ACP methyl ester carboxylesterase
MSTKPARPEELTIDVAGVTLAAKRWHPVSREPGRRVLALHGWLDNAASFDFLAPLLDADIVALDLAGHGHSYHRTLQASYDMWDDLPDILRAADALGWEQFHLLGHSRGAIISALLTATLPERILSAVLLDGVRPDTRPIEEFFDQLAQHLREHLAPAGPMAHYATIDDAVRARCIASNMSAHAARPIVERGLRQIDAGWTWRSDRRLRLPSAMRLSKQHVETMLARLTGKPHLLLLADQGEPEAQARRERVKRTPGLRWEEFSGGHHFHLENNVAAMAVKINDFWREASSD